jgi:addiction module HigA family antidote
MAKKEPIECAMRPIHPGEILRDELVELGLSARAFAEALDVPVNRVNQILRERRGVSADTALRLGRYFGTAPEFWMDLQSDYELRRARREIGPAIERSVHPRAA